MQELLAIYSHLNSNTQLCNGTVGAVRHCPGVAEGYCRGDGRFQGHFHETPTTESWIVQWESRRLRRESV